MGTQTIIFSGGEPLLREDIGKIIDYCRSKNIFTGLTSNGILVSSSITKIRNLNLLKLSFDGPPEIHDLVRGEGSYQKVIDAAEKAKKHNLKVTFNTTLSKYNLDSIDFILRKAQELDIRVKFQPLSHVHTEGRDIKSLFPEKSKYLEVISKIMNLKKRNKYIINSYSTLEYLYNWPENTGKIKCYGGKLVCCINPRGDVSNCTIMMSKGSFVNSVVNGFKKAFYNLPNAYCNGCWCTSTLELNCLLSLDLHTIVNSRKLFD